VKKKSTFIKKRIFLIGSSRSGTTLLQILLAGHSEIQSFPETAFFVNAIGVRSRIIANFGLATQKAEASLLRVLKIIDHEELNNEIPKHAFSLRRYAELYYKSLDNITMKSGKEIWLEKSPMHIRYVSFIRKYIPKVNFIHIIRNGSDVVASIYNRALNYPDRFGNQKNIRFAIKRWNQSLDISAKYYGTPNHFFLLYEELVKNPEPVLNKLCRDIGLIFESNMLDVSKTAEMIISPQHSWLFNAKHPPQIKPSIFPKIFDKKQQKIILKSLNVKRYEKLRDVILNN